MKVWPNQAAPNKALNFKIKLLYWRHHPKLLRPEKENKIWSPKKLVSECEFEEFWIKKKF